MNKIILLIIFIIIPATVMCMEGYSSGDSSSKSSSVRRKRNTNSNEEDLSISAGHVSSLFFGNNKNEIYLPALEYELERLKEEFPKDYIRIVQIIEENKNKKNITHVSLDYFSDEKNNDKKIINHVIRNAFIALDNQKKEKIKKALERRNIICGLCCGSVVCIGVAFFSTLIPMVVLCYGN